MIGLKKITTVCLILVLSSLFISCGTMAAAESARQARVAAQRAEERAKKNTSTTIASQTGSLFQRVDPNAVKIDEKTVELGQSVSTAQTHLANNDLSSSNVIAPGPLEPFLKPVLLSSADLQLTLAQYLAYAKAVTDVYVSLRAYGLVKNVEGIKQVHKIWPMWQAYFGRINVDTSQNQIAETDLKAFYLNLGYAQKAVDDALKGINQYIDRQRTRPYSSGLVPTSN